MSDASNNENPNLCFSCIDMDMDMTTKPVELIILMADPKKMADPDETSQACSGDNSAFQKLFSYGCDKPVT